MYFSPQDGNKSDQVKKHISNYILSAQKSYKQLQTANVAQ